MHSEDIRKSFLNYFKSKEHKVCKSDYLVPPSDPTLLFTTAGMVQFKPLWAGAKLDFARATSVQKCLRAGGKGSDLENVGKTLRHHTFFEMLGNFSFGDYFKKEAITWGWEFVSDVIKMDTSKIYVTVYKDDDEAASIWNKEIGIPEKRISRLGDKDNFWGPAGDEGACGPCSELLYDLGEEYSCGRADCKPGCDCERYLEFWNLVFPQYYQKKDGTRDPLQRRGIDTGLGLERLTFLLQNDAENNYETDLFKPIIEELENICETKRSDEKRHYYHIIADHMRALTFTISENILPSNEGRGYVLRRILRRAFRAGRKLDLNKPFLYKLVPIVGEIMKSRYPEIVGSREFVSKVILGEEERFEITLNNGYNMLLEDIENTSGNVFSGETIFKLYDTYGMPVDIIKDEVDEKGLVFDEKGFNLYMEQQKEKGKKSWKGADIKTSNIFSEISAKSGSTIFSGYDKNSVDSKIIALVKNSSLTNEVKEGVDAEIILNETCFYAESGGQSGDTGVIKTSTGEAKILDTVKDVNGIVIHHTKILQGKILIDQDAKIVLDIKRRKEIAKHHTATHLLQAGLRDVLGGHVKQSGSYVGSDRLRFDFSHFKALTKNEIEDVEKLVNDMINDAMEVNKYNTTYDKAVEDGVTAIFGEKYGDNVKVVDAGGKSRELCGGAHVENTSFIGGFKIMSESSVSSGIRRIEAVCGRSLYDNYSKTNNVLREILVLLKTSENEVIERVEKLLGKVKSLEKQIEKGTNLNDTLKEFEEKKDNIDDINILIRKYQSIPGNSLRAISDELKSGTKNGIFCLISTESDNKASIVLSCTKNVSSTRFHCGKLLSGLAKEYGGGGGGRPDMAQAGASKKIDLDNVMMKIKVRLAQK